ncbi:hypothetical protein PR003_g23422 [Phytophthora rubi]|uniref:Uncharacterized protein n=1 Tax=Phytophthora rubi TaxID=129364 RepID=A0A6A4CW58_9STRA|nr:hypothetical protein PR003_g23422 [Phytophthora rubi]
MPACGTHLRAVLLFLPPYCPQYNLLFEQLKKW